jgi:uncharacterized membrane protein
VISQPPQVDVPPAPPQPPAAAKRKSKTRLPFLDFARGLAATVMLQGHVFHSFLRNDLRDSGAYIISQFIGGLAPALFLFLTGTTLGFMMHGFERKPMTRWQKVVGALKRSGYLFTLAYLFRLQLYLFGLPYSHWTDLFKVDILNCMGLAIAVMAPLAALTTAQRVHGGIIVGLLIACLSPLIPANDQSTVPNLFAMYLRPDYRYFSFFPWASFVAFGVSAGSILRLIGRHTNYETAFMHRTMQWSAILGFGLIMGAQYFSNVPYSLYPATEFWLNSPGLILIKLGVIMVIIPVTFLWTHHGAGEGWSWVRQLGTTSLLVYWVHIELVYGRWFGAWKEKLNIYQCAAAAAVVILLMIGLSVLRTHVHWGWLKGRLRMGDVGPVNS